MRDRKRKDERDRRRKELDEERVQGTLMRGVGACRTEDDLLSFFEEHEGAFNRKSSLSMLVKLASTASEHEVVVTALYSDEVVTAMKQMALKHLRKMAGRELATMAWAMAKLAHEDAPFMAALLEVSLRKLGSFDPRALSKMAWALAKLGHEDAPFMAALLEVSLPKLGSFDPGDLSNLAWALAVLDRADVHSGAFLAELLEQVKAQRSRLKPAVLCQIFQAMLWMQTRHADVALPTDLYAASKRAWMNQVDDVTTSNAQRDVLHAVRQLPGCSDAVIEHLTEDGLFRIDVAVVSAGGEMVAVEVDGPTHFMSNKPTVADGSTRLRNRLLEARGWQVLCIPVVEWQAQSGKDEKAAYLKNLRKKKKKQEKEDLKNLEKMKKQEKKDLKKNLQRLDPLG